MKTKLKKKSQEYDNIGIKIKASVKKTFFKKTKQHGLTATSVINLYIRYFNKTEKLPNTAIKEK